MRTMSTGRETKNKMAPSSPDEILAQIGLHHSNGSSSGSGRDDDKGSHDDVACQVIIHLIQSGKISIDDATNAVKAVRSKSSSSKGSMGASTHEAKTSLNTKKADKMQKNNEKSNSNTPGEKYRTRHVALQFSYDGTDYSGFAQNVGKECDNSVEKALFAALEKTRLLVSPDQMMGVISSDSAVEKENADRDELEEEESKNNNQISARTASKYSRCGRTDKGVHANGQVVALYLKSAFPLLAKNVISPKDGNDAKEPGNILEDDDLPKNSLDALECFVPRRGNKKSKQETNPSLTESLEIKSITEYDYPRILNNILPSSIRILGWCPVSSDFSARFSCYQRTYRYFFPRRNLDLAAMAKGLQHMMGRHDFRNLCKMNCEQVYNFERVLVGGKVVSPQIVYSVSEDAVATQDTPQTAPLCDRDMCHVEISGQAFLWHQIRCIMSILFQVGRQLESPNIVKELLDIRTNPAKPSYDMASENALVLQECSFANLTLGRSVKNLWDVTKVLEQRWEKHALATERARDLLATVKSEAHVRWTDLTTFIEQIAKERRRKEQKRDMKLNDNGEEDIQQLLLDLAPSVEMISWGNAVSVIQKVLGVYPHLPNGYNEATKGFTDSSVHTPLMERAKGTTYEEKVQSILGADTNDSDAVRKSSKRRERYEENIIKKRKTAEEDKAFYDHMLKQGGSSV
eukprot:CCRYP_007051-RA/>CCRYP_007051-RA protein AED:0.21 eAED:0.21 QI:84/1/1/1/1/1/2/1163/687